MERENNNELVPNYELIGKKLQPKSASSTWFSTACSPPSSPSACGSSCRPSTPASLKWQQESSIIGTNPGLGFRPMPKNNEESTLIWLEGTNKANYLNWYDNIMEFLDSELPSVLPPLPRSLFPFQSTTRLVRSRRATPTSRPARTRSWPARRKCARST
jgi:hypothetical protein